MDDARACLLRSQYAEGLELLGGALSRTRDSLSPAAWRATTRELCQAHPIAPLLREDPLTRRAFEKPRGYAGDAIVLDFIYAAEPEQPPIPVVLDALRDASPAGRTLNTLFNQRTLALAVRARKNAIADRVDAFAAKIHRPRILSVAAGHLREAQRSRAVQGGRVGRYVALDQDRESLSEVERQFGEAGVETRHANVTELIRGRAELGTFDFVYATGLYDYLGKRVASHLTKVLFDALAPGGTLLIGNFTPDCYELCYLEAYMDWWLVCRTRAELEALAERVPHEGLDSMRTYTEENEVIGFLELVRRA